MVLHGIGVGEIFGFKGWKEAVLEKKETKRDTATSIDPNEQFSQIEDTLKVQNVPSAAENFPSVQQTQ